MSFEIVYIDDVYNDEVSIDVITQPFHKGHNTPLVMMNCDNDMMLTPENARKLAAALILAAEECEK